MNNGWDRVMRDKENKSWRKYDVGITMKKADE